MERKFFDWKFALTILAAVAGLIVPVWLWKYDVSSRSITVSLISSIQLLQGDPSGAKLDLQLTLENVSVENPYLSTIEISNNGAKPISASEYETPIEISTGAGSKLVKVKLADTQPKGIPALVGGEGSTIKLQPTLLNPSDTLSIVVITSGARPVFSPSARIAGVHQITYVDSTGRAKSWSRALGAFAFALLAVILYFYYTAHLFGRGIGWGERLITLATMLVCMLGGSRYYKMGLQLAGYELSDSSLLIILLAVAVGCYPIYKRQLGERKRRHTALL